MQHGESGSFGTCGDQQGWERNGAMLGRAGQQRLHLQRSVDDAIGYRYAGHSSQDLRKLVVRGRARRAVEKLEVDDAASCYPPGQEKWFDHVPHFWTSIAARECALVRQVRRHVQSAPGAGHHVGIVELESTGREQQVNETSTLLQLDHLIKGRVHGVGQRPSAEDFPGRLHFAEVDLK